MKFKQSKGLLILVPHPLCIKPSGNQFLSENGGGQCDIGRLGILPHEILLECLDYLDRKSLANSCCVCQGLYAFATFDELWKKFDKASTPWMGTWRESSYQHLLFRLQTPNLYSDALFRPFMCSQLDLYKLLDKADLNIPILSSITKTRFESISHKPFILQNSIDEWPALRKWDIYYLENRWGNKMFKIGAFLWPLKKYIAYMRNNVDESPLYLFDEDFSKNTDLCHDYWAPGIFDTDFFQQMKEYRPDYRWLIIGPKRSGSSFHQDPNFTSAWNAVIKGKKFWMMFPPNVIPPGTFISKDQSEVTSPISIAEWFISFYDIAANHKSCYQGICNPGEIVYVPTGWFHLAVNLEDTIAITQNFVPERFVADVLHFLKTRPAQVTGFPVIASNPYTKYAAHVQLHTKTIPEGNALNRSDRKRGWGSLIANSCNRSDASFSFEFHEI